MACECAICKNNKPFTFPKEIIDAAQKKLLLPLKEQVFIQTLMEMLL